MASNTSKSVFTRPGYLAASALVVLLVAGAIFLTVRGLTTDEPGDPISPSVSASPTQGSATTPPEPSPTSTPEETSVCGLPDGSSGDRLVAAPATDWDYIGTTAVPSSHEFGPGETTEGGMRYCFQRSPEGALVMAANAVAQGSSAEINAEWFDYVLSNGQYRDAINEESTGEIQDRPGVRINIAGFRLLEYNGSTATIDIAARSTVDGQAFTVSAIYHIVWEDGDWKMNTDHLHPMEMTVIPDLTGYIGWGE